MRRDRLVDDRGVLLRRQPIHDHVPVGVDHAQPAVVRLQLTFGADQAHVQGGEVGEDRDLFAEALELAGKPVQGLLGELDRLGQHGQDRVAVFRAQRLVHAAGHNPAGMDAFAAQNLDDLLPDLAQPDAVTRQRGIGLRPRPRYCAPPDRRPCPAADRARKGRRSSGRVTGRSAPD